MLSKFPDVRLPTNSNGSSSKLNFEFQKDRRNQNCRFYNFGPIRIIPPKNQLVFWSQHVGPRYWQKINWHLFDTFLTPWLNLTPFHGPKLENRKFLSRRSIRNAPSLAACNNQARKSVRWSLRFRWNIMEQNLLLLCPLMSAEAAFYNNFDVWK